MCRLAALLTAALIGAIVLASLVPGRRLAQAVPDGTVLAANPAGGIPAREVPSAVGAALGETSGCTGTIVAAPSRDAVRICDQVTVTVRTTVACSARPVHFVAIVPNATAIDPGFLRQTLRAIVGELQSAEESGLAVEAAVVSFRGVVRDWCPDFPGPYSQGARTLVDMTDDLDQLLGVGWSYGQELCGDYPAGAAEAARVLAKASRDTAGPPTEIVMFLAATTYCLLPAPGCGDQCRAAEMLIAAARSLQAEAPTLLSVCTLDMPPDPFCHVSLCDSARQIVPRSRYSRANTAQAVTILDRELAAAARGGSAMESRTIVQELPPGLEYVADSASEPPGVAYSAPGGTRLTWAYNAPSASLPLTVTYRVMPRAEGQHVILGAMTLTDTAKAVGVVGMQPVTITVSGSCATPSSEPSPTATPMAPTSTPTPVATGTATCTATAVPTRPPRPAYVPLALAEQCAPGQQRVDVALVIDASTSMVLERTGDGRTKLEAAVEAARDFLDLVRLEAGDQAAVITFNDSATVRAPLTSDRGALEAALTGIATAQHTCLVCAVDVAATELTSERHSSANTPVLILLTDGKSNPRPVSEAVVRAQQAKQAGVVIFTIGLGTQLDDAALAEIATQPAFYYRVPTADALGAIYRQIAVSIPCPREQFWGQR